MTAPICLITARLLRGVPAARTVSGTNGFAAPAGLRELLAATPPAVLDEDEFGFVSFELAQAWQPYFDALGLSGVNVRALQGEQFRQLLAACIPMTFAVQRWLDRPEAGEPVDDFERYLEAVATETPEAAALPEHLARLRDALCAPAEVVAPARHAARLALVKG